MPVLYKVEESLDTFFVKKLPVLPYWLKNIIVKLLPILCLVEVVFLVFFLIGSAILGGVTLFETLHYLATNNNQGFFSGFFSVFSIYLPLLTIPIIIFNIYGLVKRKLVSWRINWWLLMINLLTFSFLVENVFFLVYPLLISYLLFQIREFYK